MIYNKNLGSTDSLLDEGVELDSSLCGLTGCLETMIWIKESELECLESAIQSDFDELMFANEGVMLENKFTDFVKKTFEWIKTKLKELWAKIKSIFAALKAKIVKFFAGVKKEAKYVFDKAKAKIKTGGRIRITRKLRKYVMTPVNEFVSESKKLISNTKNAIVSAKTTADVDKAVAACKSANVTEGDAKEVFGSVTPANIRTTLENKAELSDYTKTITVSDIDHIADSVTSSVFDSIEKSVDDLKKLLDAELKEAEAAEKAISDDDKDAVLKKSKCAGLRAVFTSAMHDVTAISSALSSLATADAADKKAVIAQVKSQVEGSVSESTLDDETEDNSNEFFSEDAIEDNDFDTSDDSEE